LKRFLSLTLLGLAVAAPLGAQVADSAPAPLSALRIDINIPEIRLRLYDGDSLLKVYRISVGLPGHETPDGEFSIDHAEWNPWWRPPPDRAWSRNDHITPPGPNNPMGRVKLFFAPYYYIHGSPHVRDLGTAASHGCVRMLNADVVELGRLLHARNQGTLSNAEITRVLARSGETRASRLAVPVPLTLRYDPILVRGEELRIYPDFYHRNRVHSEGVIQALIAAGYDPASVDRAAVQAVLRRAAATRGLFTVPLAEAFPGLRPATLSPAIPAR
jgi:murein L,D-transpeptidase YcbB/YkuD